MASDGKSGGEQIVEQVDTGMNPNRRARLSLSKKALFSLLACVFFFGVLELALFAVGVKITAYDKDPYVGFTSQNPLFVEEQSADGFSEMVTANNKLAWFNLQQFSRKKQAGTNRVFCVGGSTTYGRPYGDATSYCGWLREFLKASDASHPWEVINAGGISYASYRVALLMEELIEYEPDLFIIYSGQNEFLERRTYGSIIETPAAVRGLGAILSRTRTYSLIQNLTDAGSKAKADQLSTEVRTVLDQSVGLSAYTRDDELKEQVLDHYRYNLLRMIDIARSAGAKVILVAPASNLRNCTPFKSENRAGINDTEFKRWQKLFNEARQSFEAKQFDKAMAALDEATQIDPRHAHLQYLRGRVLDELGRYDEAKSAFQKSRDEDVCPLRALTPMRTIVAGVSQDRNVPLVDFISIVEKKSDQGIPGENLFLDHVHPTIEGNRLLALALFDEMKQQRWVQPAKGWNAAAIQKVVENVESRLDTRAHGLALCNLAQVLNWSGKVEESGKLALLAVEMIPDSGEAHFLAGCEFARRGELAPARTHFERALELKPNPIVAQSTHDNLGLVLSLQNELDLAEAHFLDAIRLDPRSARAQDHLGLVLAKKGDLHAAISRFERAIRLEPEYTMGHFNLATAFANQGNFARAQRHYEIVLQLQPNHPEARQRLQELRASRRSGLLPAP